MSKITPFLWFNDNAEEALNFYASIFKNSRIINVNRLPEGTPGPAGKVLTASFELEGQEFMALNGGPDYKFNEAISFYVNCETQQEVDYFWNKLSAGGEPGPCGWLKDKFGVSWQIVPIALGQMLGDPNPKKSQSVMQAMLKMKKIEIAELKRAYEQA